MTQVRRALVVAAAIAVAGCSAGSTDLADDPDLATLPPPITLSVPTDTTSESSAVTTAAPATDATVDDAGATPDTTAAAPGTEPEPDWAGIVHELLLTQFELQSDPDLDRITELCSEPSPCLDTSDIAGLANSGQRLVGGAPPARPDSAVLIDTSEDLPWDVATFSILRVTRVIEEVPDGAAIVDADGNVVFNVSLSPGRQPGDAVESTWTITRASGEWRLFEIAT